MDIDLTYLPLKNRMEAFEEIKQGIQRIGIKLNKLIPNVQVMPQRSGGTISKLFVKANDVQIKLEVNTVIRGSVFAAVEKELSHHIQEKFQMYAAVKILPFEDLYGGKICAAIDRQHPRDLYDVRLLLNNEGITDGVRKAFIGYLISHSRPINELLNPNIKPIEEVYHKEFSGMTDEDNILPELQEIQKKLSGLILGELTVEEKKFLMSFKKGTPDWELIKLPGLKDLPGVKWKLLNLSRMDSQKHSDAIEKLEKILMTA